MTDNKENYVLISNTENIEEKIRKAAAVKPTASQLEWQKLEMCAFIHFGMNTFTDLEWGDGTASPQTFNLGKFEAEESVKLLKKVGFKGIILTCKHHDGFCLWPSKFTDYTVAKSPYKNGRGDLVRELSDACRKYGVKFGVYLSPWDRHDERYGDSPRYNEYFLNQLTELLTEYGDIYEVWFDGACAEGINGKIQKYDWNAYYSLIRRLQPNAVISIEGPDVRWVGNEAGQGREEEWSAVPGVLINDRLGLTRLTADATAEILAGDNELKQLPENTNCLYWSPAQVDVSVRQGWFYHEWMNNSIKSLYEIVKIYDSSVGANASLLLNIPLDTEGKINAADKERLIQFGNYLNSAYRYNLIDRFEYDDLSGRKIVTAYLNKPQSCNCIVLAENIENGQKISSYRIKAKVDGECVDIASGKTVGYKKIIGFKDKVISEFYIEVTGSRAVPEILSVKAFKRPELVQPPEITRDYDGNVTVKNDLELPMKYSLNVSEMFDYSKPFLLNGSGKVCAYTVLDGEIVASAEKKFGILKKNWSASAGDRHSEEYLKYARGEKQYICLNGFPNSVVLDFGKTEKASGIIYNPIDNAIDFLFNIFEIEISTGNNGEDFKIIYKGKLDNIKNNPVPVEIDFKGTVDCRYMKITAISGFDSRIAGIGAIDLV